MPEIREVYLTYVWIHSVTKLESLRKEIVSVTGPSSHRHVVKKKLLQNESISSARRDRVS